MTKNSPKAFAELIKKYSYIGRQKTTPLVNITFFVGAGFSKAWDTRFPTGAELFSFKCDLFKELTESLSDYLLSQAYDINTLVIDHKLFKDLVYEVTMLQKYPDTRPRYVDKNNLAILLNDIKVLVLKLFEQKIDLNNFDNELKKFLLPNKLTIAQKSILDFFKFMEVQQTGDSTVPEGIRYHFITTNYDYLIETIMDNVISSDDSFLLYCYRGISPKEICGMKNPQLFHDHWLVNNLIKINGGFEIIMKNGEYFLDYNKRSFEELVNIPPVIMLPSREQDYTDNYFSSIFPKAIRLLQETKILVIVGSSLPEEDALLRYLLRQFAESPRDAIEKNIFYVDHMKVNEQKNKLKTTFPYSWFKYYENSIPYSGNFSNWAKEVLSFLD